MLYASYEEGVLTILTEQDSDEFQPTFGQPLPTEAGAPGSMGAIQPVAPDPPQEAQPPAQPLGPDDVTLDLPPGGDPVTSEQRQQLIKEYRLHMGQLARFGKTLQKGGQVGANEIESSRNMAREIEIKLGLPARADGLAAQAVPGNTVDWDSLLAEFDAIPTAPPPPGIDWEEVPGPDRGEGFLQSLANGDGEKPAYTAASQRLDNLNGQMKVNQEAAAKTLARPEFLDLPKGISEEQLAGGAGAVAVGGASMIPGVGEAMDVPELLDPNSSLLSKTFAAGSLLLSAFSLGYAPNYGALRRAADAVTPAAKPAEKTGARVWKWGTSKIGDDAAEAAYQAIRDSKTDVAAIAQYTGYKPERLQKIKDYLFNNPEWTGADGEIAAAWHRLRTGRGTEPDRLPLKHETAEMWYRNNVHPSYEEAHRRSNRRWNWQKAVEGGS